MHSLDVFSADAWEALQHAMQLLKEEIGVALIYDSFQSAGCVAASSGTLVLMPSQAMFANFCYLCTMLHLMPVLCDS